jgi:pantoate--beta-alanine ligase
MGAFHAGHVSLMRHAREQCGVVVVSLFVNPSQFNQGADLDAYPRDEARDVALAAEAGVDYLFAPSVTEVYPTGFASTVSVGTVTEPLEGAHRGRSHFDGVTTVVTKLLNMVGPDVAFFGQKDAQQALVVKQLVTDLNFPVTIAVCPTVREPDGLALSSRNVRLDRDERARATALNRALEAAAALAGHGVTDAGALLGAARAELTSAELEPEYLALVDSEDLTEVTTLTGTALLLIAARLGSTRLIDNRLISTRTPSPSVSPDPKELTCDARC